MMIPKLTPDTQQNPLYLEFFEELRRSAYSGDICPEYTQRTTLATDNSIYQVLPQGVLYPKHRDDIVCITTLINETRYREIVLSPRGGGTGTNGQSLCDGIIVDLSKHMNRIIEINAEEGWAIVETGVVKDQLNAALAPHGLFFAPDLSTSNRATIGGMINTDASGQGSCQYGKTRDHVLELETVLMDGSVMNTAAIPAESRLSDAIPLAPHQDIHARVDNIYQENRDQIHATFPPLNRCLTGYDLAHIRDEHGQLNLNNILCGSEGTLGFITQAKLNILALPKVSALIIVKYRDFQASLKDATSLMNASPASIETIDSKVLGLAMRDFIWHQVESFFDDDDESRVKGINFVEFTADDEALLHQTLQKFQTYLSETTTEDNARLGFSVAMGRSEVNKIWAMRKRAVGLLGNAQGEARPIPFVEDTAVPPENLADFIAEFRTLLDSYQLNYGMFGHVDAGVLHVRPAIDMKDPAQEAMAWEISDKVAALTQKYGGLLWGEHGKGVRSAYSPDFFGELYPCLQEIKAAFDPHNQLNPGKIATPNPQTSLLKIDEVTTRGQRDRTIAKDSWNHFDKAVYCNGNGVCYNWNENDPMCPSWKATRNRAYSPKGRASLIREWLRLLSKQNYRLEKTPSPSLANSLISLPQKVVNHWQRSPAEKDFSDEVYDAMASCLACKSCSGQCPIKVDVPAFRSQFLAYYHTRYFRPLKDYLVGSLEFALPLAAVFPRIYNALMKNRLVKKGFEKYIGFVDSPALSGITLKKLGVEFATPQKIRSLSKEEKQKTVIIVQDAFTSYFDTPMVHSCIALIKKLCFNPLVAPFSPNGKPLHVHGFLNTFNRIANKNIARLSVYADEKLPMIGIDPSMTLTYRSEYSEALKKNNQEINVLLFQEWLNQALTTLGEDQRKALQTRLDNQTFVLMPHCTEKTNAASAMKDWQSIFTAFGATLETQSVGCCGMAGTFGHEKRNLDTSKKLFAMSWEKPLHAAEQNQTPALVTGYSCRSQIKRLSHHEVIHPATLLNNALKDSCT